MPYEKVGEFEVTSGVIRATDPCYSKDTWCAGTFKAQNGIWHAFKLMSNQGEWGLRVAELVVVHESALAKEVSLKRSDIHGGVDSGQFGFFDEAKYPDHQDKHEGVPEWQEFYDKIFPLTHPEKEVTDTRSGALFSTRKVMECSGGCLQFGAVSSSGFGDGSYSILVASENGQPATAAMVLYIDEDEENLDDDDDPFETIAVNLNMSEQMAKKVSSSPQAKAETERQAAL